MNVQNCNFLTITFYARLMFFGLETPTQDFILFMLFEVEISTGVWSGFGRLATLRDYDTRPYIVTNENKKFQQVITQFPEIKSRFVHVMPDQIGLLYSAEKI